ncbi:glycosyltransferase [Enterococcus hailinensis]|uniref:glycosyltransferase n=1 Tax=Enterococcus hailinensis TaxID=3238988 RepID=UPI0038B3694B
MNKKKVLLIIEAMGGGGGRHVQDLILNLDQNLFELSVIYSPERSDTKFLDNLKKYEDKAALYECETLTREINLKKDKAAYIYISKKIKDIKPDIVHCHSSKAGVIGRIAAKRHGIKKIFYTPHAYSFLAPEFGGYKKNLFILIEHFLSRYATTQTFCVSKGEKDSAISYKIDKSEKFSVIYNGLPAIELPEKNEVKQQLGLKSTDIVIGNNARLSEQKNPMLFMKIAKELINKNNSYHFIWVGDGPLMADTKRFIQENDIEDNIHLFGYREDSELIVAGYDIFLITSLYEGLPYAPIEAMRAGVPIIATNVVGNQELINQSENGYLIELNEINNIFEVFKNTFVLQKKSIQVEFERNYSLSRMIDSIGKFYLKQN